MRRLLFLATFLLAAAPALFAATEIPQIVSPCSSPSVSPSETLAVEGDVLVYILGNSTQYRTCPYTIYTTTPDVISVGTLVIQPNGFTYLNVIAVGPGEGILMMRSLFVGGITNVRQVSAIHVDTCVAGSHSIQLRPEYAGAAFTDLEIAADVHGMFSGGLHWYINGQYIFDGPTLKYRAPGNGVYHLELRGQSGCGVISARADLVVGGRARAVRRR